MHDTPFLVNPLSAQLPGPSTSTTLAAHSISLGPCDPSLRLLLISAPPGLSTSTALGSEVSPWLSYQLHPPGGFWGTTRYIWNLQPGSTGLHVPMSSDLLAGGSPVGPFPTLNSHSGPWKTQSPRESKYLSHSFTQP